MYKKLSIIAILLLFSLLLTGQDGYKAMLEALYEDTVPLVNPGEVKDKGAILLDARSIKEYQVSHIAGARFTDYDSFDANQLSGIPKDRPIIVYCSVGYRSERVGEKLLAAGHKNVYNMYGGIFQWVNEGRPVVNSKEQPTDSVHTYSMEWSVWLHKGVRVYD